jgi:isoaspartyl peptidase/L-asparaginase-like protein (Ntn-hydrolase superfamily)
MLREESHFKKKKIQKTKISKKFQMLESEVDEEDGTVGVVVRDFGISWVDFGR